MTASAQQVSPGETLLTKTQSEELLGRIGQVTRTLHNSLTELGLDKMLEQVAQDIPDVRDRLNYVARMTEQAADRVLNATDAAIPLQAELASEATVLQERWKEVLASNATLHNQAVEETQVFLAMTDKHTAETKALLMDIMMAQDFQDLTGQVINRIMSLAHVLETQLVQLLIDFSPPGPNKDTDPNAALLNGPQVTPNAATGVADQEQVDDLLASLGF